jgi:hypothetical protein
MDKSKNLPYRLTTVILLLLSFSICAFNSPNAYAANTPTNSTIEETIASLAPDINTTRSALEEKGIAIFNVIDLDTTKYMISSRECAKDTYLGVIPQENIRYTLDDKESKLDILYTFTDGNVRVIHVLERC